MSKLTDQAHAYAAIDNCTHDKSFFVAYEGFKAGAEWYSREMAKRSTGKDANELKSIKISVGELVDSTTRILDATRIYLRDLRPGGLVVGRCGQSDPTASLIKISNEVLMVKFSCFLSRIEVAQSSGNPIKDLRAEFDKFFDQVDDETH